MGSTPSNETFGCFLLMVVVVVVVFFFGRGEIDFSFSNLFFTWYIFPLYFLLLAPNLFSDRSSLW